MAETSNGVEDTPPMSVNFVPCTDSPVKEATDYDIKDPVAVDYPLETGRPCDNPNCSTRTGLRPALQHVRTYFYLPDVAGLKVCATCQAEADEYQDAMVERIRRGESVFSQPKRPQGAVLVAAVDDDPPVKEEPTDTEMLEVEEDVDQFIQAMMKKYRFEEQVDAAVDHLNKSWSRTQDKATQLSQEQDELEKQLNELRHLLYDGHAAELKHLEPIDLDEDGNVIAPINPVKVVPIAENEGIAERLKALPPVGEFQYPAVRANQAVYALRSSLLSPWGKARVLRIKSGESTTGGGDQNHVIRFDGGGKPRSVLLKNLAYAEPSPVQLTVGHRVIAQYIERSQDGKSRPALYYAGIIAETPKFLNEYRYLIFFDDGYAQYCTHDQVCVVCHRSKEVWQDIHMNTRSFISNYLQQFPERAMVKLQKGQMVKTELNGRWLVGRVDLVDASLAHIFFVVEGRHEWIYRGSTRLQPLYELMAGAEARKRQGATRPAHNLANVHKKKNAPYVEYTRGLDADADVVQDRPPANAPVDPAPPVAAAAGDAPAAPVAPAPTAASAAPASPAQPLIRAVARKSTSKPVSSPAPTVAAAVTTAATTTAAAATAAVASGRPEAVDAYASAEHRGRFVAVKCEKYQEVRFEPHQCGPKCVAGFPYQDGDYKDRNPLLIPMLLGWSRQVSKQRLASRRSVGYRAPCGRRMRNMHEVHRYLRLTGCQLGVDLFSFDQYVHCFTEFEPLVVYSRLNDIAGGKENVRVSCVNSIDRSYPEYIEYSAVRTPREGVRLNLDPGFLVCCDCTDDCQDKDKCQCCQLTIQGTKCTGSGKTDHNAGYQYRRLLQRVMTGIYECNDRCSCRKTCLNRVVQRPLQLRLQAFKTERRGWGIRCLDDIPKGGFICVYAGHLLTDQEANEDGKQIGDEYLAELDLIEVVEKSKDGYESDVDVTDSDQASNSEGEDSSSSEGIQDDETSKDSTATKPTTTTVATTATTTTTTTTSVAVASSATSPATSLAPAAEVREFRKTRELYGKDEHIYVMDAKCMGNIGRYLNHCCKPNVVVQNVFVDTQDLRFPWVAFFAQVYIRAGTELTWDYSYQVDSVPGKKLYCHCGAKECKGRLL